MSFNRNGSVSVHLINSHQYDYRRVDSAATVLRLLTALKFRGVSLSTLLCTAYLNVKRFIQNTGIILVLLFLLLFIVLLGTTIFNKIIIITIILLL